MKIILKDHQGLCEELPYKTQTVQVNSFFSYLEVEIVKGSNLEIYINEDRFEYEDGDIVQVPCYMSYDNLLNIQFISKQGTIRIAVKYDSSMYVGEERIQAFADFHGQVLNWSGSEIKPLSELIKAIQEGEISLLQMIDPLTGLDDQSLLDDISKALSFALDICSKPRQHLYMQEEILDVELVKRVTPAALQHLASHSEHWYTRTITGLIPSRLRSEVYEDDINIYENIFFRMVIQAILTYVTHQKEKVRAAIAQKETLHDWQHYAEEANDYKKLEMLLKLIPNYNMEEDNKLKKEFQNLAGKLLFIEKQLSSIVTTSFYQKLDPIKRLVLPIQPTNIINMDNRYNEMLKIWNRLIQLTNLKKQQDEITGATISNVQLYYESYTKILMIYALNLMGFHFSEGSTISMKKSGLLNVSFSIDTDSFAITGRDKLSDLHSVFEIKFEEKLAVECILPREFDGDLSMLLDSQINEEENMGARKLIFRKRPTIETERQISQLMRKYIDNVNNLSIEQKRRMTHVEKEWRKQVAEIVSNMPATKQYTLYIHTIFGLIGTSESEIMRYSTALLESLPKQDQESHILVMPIELMDFDKLANRRLMKRLLNFGEGYDVLDSLQYGSYRTGMFPVSQKDLRSIQRFSKLFFITYNRLEIEWKDNITHCPSCQSVNIEQEGNHSWRCRESSCQLVWGRTRCTNGCQSYFEWMRPNLNLKFREIMDTTPLNEVLFKEKIFDHLVLTDFEIYSNHHDLNYSPVCPKCGNSNV